jgi:hypothetical protein
MGHCIIVQNMPSARTNLPEQIFSLQFEGFGGHIRKSLSPPEPGIFLVSTQTNHLSWSTLSKSNSHDCSWKKMSLKLQRSFIVLRNSAVDGRMAESKNPAKPATMWHRHMVENPVISAEIGLGGEPKTRCRYLPWPIFDNTATEPRSIIVN